MQFVMVAKRRPKRTRLPGNVALRMASRNVLRQRGRALSVLAAIAFGVMSLVVAQGFLEDVFRQLAEAIVHSQSGHIQLARRGFFENGAHQPEKYIVSDPEGDKKRIANLPEVQNVMSRLTFSGLLNNGKADLSVVGEGIEPGPEQLLGTHMKVIEGRRLSDDDRYGALVGKGVAAALALKPGDRVVLLMNTSDGAMNSLDIEIVGVFQTFSKDYDDRGVKIHLSAAQSLLNTNGASALVVLLRKTSETARAAAILKERTVWRDQDVRTWIDLNDFYLKTVELYRMQFGGLQLIILLMVLLSVINAMNSAVSERAAEFGTTRALGNRSADVFRVVMSEAALLGVLGSTLGVLIALGVGTVIRKFGIPMPPPPNSDLSYIAYVSITWIACASAFCIGVVATLAATTVPAWNVARLPVVEALRQGV